MKRALCAVLLVLLLSLISLPALASGYGLAFIDGVTADRVHLREGPSSSYASLGLYFTGTQVVILGYSQGWTRVLIGNEEGYVASRYLSTSAVEPEQPLGDVRGGRTVNFRGGPGTDYDILERIYSGDTLTLLGETYDGWYYARDDETGVTGYLMSDYVSVRSW